MLVDAFPACGPGVFVATDGTLYQTEVYAASHWPAALASLQHQHASASSAHGHLSPASSHEHGSTSLRRLSHMLYTFPQSGDGLFYLDPHHARPPVPLRPYVPSSSTSTPAHAPSTFTTHDLTRNGPHAPDTRHSLSPEVYARGGSMSPEYAYGRGGSMSPEGGCTMDEEEG
ncbi:hypothetical protein B0H17DRAFT_1215916 [Mycena rosella]|nr:hypothetical protein C8R44DRAFT_894731 [Mycena epipterygia]KAJ7645788.1 hypothetical protein B0H17DRAFT_1215916 [Mycena rosella]